jgi:hypothetical protein
LTLGPHASKHLVLDLDQISRIEELAVDESRISNVARVRIDRAAFLEGALLAVRLGTAANSL